MLRNSIKVALAAVLLVGFAGVAFGRNHDDCTLAGLEGSWGITVTGTIIISTGATPPFATVGRLTFDAFGNMSAKQTNSAGGVISKDELVLGKVQTLNPDCTGTFRVQVEDANGSVSYVVFDFVVDDNMTEIRAIATSMVRPNVTVSPVLVFNARKMSYKNRNN
jgi:hypothetical protein